jgi:predicted DNA-binding ribbon-helix-helix protein
MTQHAEFEALVLRARSRRERKGKRDWKRQYRLAKVRWHYQNVRLDHEDAQMLKAIAKRRKTSVAELIRTYVTWGLMEDDSARRSDDL